MAEEIIIKVDGLQELKNIEATFKTFVTSINAAVTAIGAAGGTNSLSGAIGKVTAETKKHSQAIDENKVKQQQLNAIEKERIIASSEYSKATEKLLAQTKILQREIDSLVKSGQTESALYREKTARLANMTQEYDRLQKATGLAQMKQTGMYGATYQLSQVMRELPNFAIDARIGFLSLSNNLPMLLDSFKQLSMEIDDITGKPKGFKGAMAAFGQSLLGLNTFFVIGTTLLTVYGEKIVDWAKEILGASAYTDEFQKALGDLNAQYLQQQKVTSEWTTNLNAAKSGIIDADFTLKSYNNTLGETYGNAKTLDEALSNITLVAPRYVSALIDMAKANIVYNKALKLIGEAAAEEEAGKPSILQRIGSFLNPQNFLYPNRRGNVLSTAFQDYVKGINDKKNKAESFISDAEAMRNEIAEKYKKDPFILDLLGISDDKTKLKKDKKEKIDKLDSLPLLYDTNWKDSLNQFFNDQDKIVKDRLAKQANITSEEYNKNMEKAGEVIDKNDQKLSDNTQKQFERDTADREKELNDLIKYQELKAESIKNTSDYALATAELEGKNTFDLKMQMLNAEEQYQLSKVELTENSEKERYAIEKFYSAKREDLKKQEMLVAMDTVGQALSAMAGLMGENTQEQKILSTAAALINTYVGITKALADTSGGVVTQIAGAIAVGATGFAAVKKIWETDIENPSTSDNTSSTISKPSYAALSPQKTAMTSSEENLNMMLSNREKVTSVVKVSEINNVQNRVAVRENNQMY